MAYNANIPQATNQISVSQGQILDNFQFLNTIASGIFVAPVQTSAPVIAAGSVSLYNLNYVPTSRNELFFTDQSGVSYPISAALSSGVSGWTYLPSGMKIVWGQDTIAGGSSTKTTLFSSVTGFPGFSTSALGIQLTRIHNTTSTNFIQLESNTNLQFVARKSTSTIGSADVYTWLAIGR